MALSEPRTLKFTIDAPEVRIGGLSLAGKLGVNNSIGVVDSVTFDMQVDTAELLTGAPQQLAAKQTTKAVTGFTAKVRETSRRNLMLALGLGIPGVGAASDYVRGSVDTTNAIVEDANTTVSVPAALATSLTAGDLVVLVSLDNPEKISMNTVAGVGASNPLFTVQFSERVSTGATPNAFEAGERVILYVPRVVPGGIGENMSVPYTAQVLVTNQATGLIQIWNFWKVFVTPSSVGSVSPTEFSSFDLAVSAIKPIPIEYRNAQSPLYAMRNRIARSPTFELIDVPDSATSRAVYTPPI